ncbi:hypothetical protein HanIR_Chr15g0766171 [Helianthus annuus]|nr:hypothetical protein HanIR_Chr15g0766171 [Helianthus annuus]
MSWQRHVEGTSKRIHTNVQAQIHSKLLKGTQKVGPRTNSQSGPIIKLSNPGPISVT